MRLLVWSDLFWPYIGGAEVFVAKLMLRLRERGYQPLVITSHDYLKLPDQDSYQGIPVHRFPFRRPIRGGDLTQLAEARRNAAELKAAFAPDLVHVNSVGPSLLLHLMTADAHPAPWLVRLQQEVLPSQANGRDTVLGHAVRSADWVVAVSDMVLAQARSIEPGITSRSSAIRGGVEVGEAPAASGRPRVLALGRLVPAKGLDVLLTAFAFLSRRLPKLRLTIAGDGVARPELERRAKALGIKRKVDFLGWVEPDGVQELIATATVVAMPSRREGLPQAALQAAAMARPIVASRVGGLPEIVEHGETGLLVEPEDPPGLAAALAYLLERPDEGVRMGLAARERIRETMSLARCVDAYDELYRTLTRNQ